LHEHSGNLSMSAFRQLVILNSFLEVSLGFQETSRVEIGVFQVDSVVVLRHFHRFLPIPTRLVHLVQQVKSAAGLVEFLGFRQHVQLDRDHGQFGLLFRFFFSFSDRFGASREPHVPDADLRHV
jgi:hypothetical protein